MGFSPGTGEEAEILHIALAPAQIALDEVRQAGRVLLPALELIGDDAHLVARRAHQRGLHLVMAQHMAAEGRPAGQQRKAAMGDEGLQPDDGVMAPIGPARSLPPGDPDGMGAHAMAHAELEDPREGALRRLAGNQRLEDAEPRIGLHDPHQAQHRRGGHQAVGIEHDHMVVVAVGPLGELAQIACLEAGIRRPAPVVKESGAGMAKLERGEFALLGRGDLGLAAVAQQMKGEAVGPGRGLQALDHGIEPGEDARHILMADGKADGDPRGDRRLPSACGEARDWYSRRDRRTSRRMTKPMIEFQKASKVQGSPARNKIRIARRGQDQPPLPRRSPMARPKPRRLAPVRPKTTSRLPARASSAALSITTLLYRPPITLV